MLKCSNIYVHIWGFCVWFVSFSSDSRGSSVYRSIPFYPTLHFFSLSLSNYTKFISTFRKGFIPKKFQTYNPRVTNIRDGSAISSPGVLTGLSNSPNDHRFNLDRGDSSFDIRCFIIINSWTFCRDLKLD